MVEELTNLERYQLYLSWLHNYPRFESADEGISAVDCPTGENRVFVVEGSLGVYHVHRMYWQRDELVSQNDFSFTRSELARLRHDASLEIGQLELENRGISH